MGQPVGRLGIRSPSRGQHVLDREGYDVGEADRALLGVRKSRDHLAADDRSTIRGPHVLQHPRRMAHGGDWFAAGKRRFDERDRFRILRKVPERTMSARIEHAVKPLHGHGAQRHCVCEQGLGDAIRLEAMRGFGRGFRVIARRINRRLPALGRRQGQRRARIREDVVRCGEFLQPEPGLATRVAELTVRGQDHEDARRVASLGLQPGQSFRAAIGREAADLGGNERLREPLRDRGDGAVGHHGDAFDLPLVVTQKANMGCKGREAVPSGKRFGLDQQAADLAVPAQIGVRISGQPLEILHRQRTEGRHAEDPARLDHHVFQHKLSVINAPIPEICATWSPRCLVNLESA